MNWGRRIKSSDLSKTLPKVLRSLKEGPVFIERYSEVVAVLLSAEEYERLTKK